MAHVSVIVPVYNQTKWLRECLDSILLQTYRDIEVICVDDGSTDDSLSILQAYAAHDARVVVIPQENHGAAAARNVALDVAVGEWVMFMDGDDLYPDQEVISEIISGAEATGVEISGGGIRVVGSLWSEAGFLIKEDGVMDFRDYQYDYGFTRFAYKLDLLKRNNIRFPDLVRQEDPVFFVRAMTAAGKFNALKRLTYLYRASQSYSKIDWFAPPYLCAKDTLTALIWEMEMANRDDLANLRILLFKRLLDFSWLWKNNLIVELRKELFKFFSIAGVRVSVVIPIFNVERYLRECLDSVVSQVFPQLEIICVNDGSTDGSRKILDEYPQVRIIDQRNAGLGAARNVGLDAATGKYIYFLDSDDKILPETIAYLVLKCETESLDQIIFEAEPFSDGQVVTAENLAKERHYHTVHPSLCDQVFSGPIFLKNALPYDLPVTQQVRFFRRAFLMKHRLRYPEGILHEDNAFAWISAFLSERISAVGKRFYLRRVRSGSIMNSTDNLMRRSDGCLRNIEMVLAFRPFWDADLELRKKVLRYCVGALAGNALFVCGDEWRWRMFDAPEPSKAPAGPPPFIPPPFIPPPFIPPPFMTTFFSCARNAPGRMFVYSLPWGVVLAYKKLFARPMLKHTVFTRRCRWIKYLFPYGFIRYWTRRRFGEL